MRAVQTHLGLVWQAYEETSYSHTDFHALEVSAYSIIVCTAAVLFPNVFGRRVVLPLHW